MSDIAWKIGLDYRRYHLGYDLSYDLITVGEDMSDIVERLREPWNMPELPAWVQSNWAIRQEAADEIERLRAALRTIEQHTDGLLKNLARAALEEK